MKRIVMTCLSVLLFGVQLSGAAPLKISIIDWCPQLCPGKEYAGYVMDTMNMIFEGSPYEVEIQTYPWSRAIYSVKTGQSQALLSPAKSEAPELLYPEHEIGIQRMCFFTTKASQWTYSGAESLSGLQIGLATDTSVEELNSYITENSHQFQLMPYNDTYISKSLKKLDAGRIDTFLFTYNTTLYEMKALGLDADYRSAGCVSFAKIYMAFTPNSSQRPQIEKLMTYFDEKMGELKQSGKIGQIMTRYGLEDWQQYVK